MTRRQLLHFLSACAALVCSSNAKGLGDMPIKKTGERKMPVLFVGHGSPMNAIEENEFTAGFRTIDHDIAKPEAIVCISAHWETWGLAVTAMPKPRTIHDFGGFPKELYEVRYPAAGAPELAKEIADNLGGDGVSLDRDWGLDHGCWVPLIHMYPQADVPVVQVSLDSARDARWHYNLGKRLSWLRRRRVLVVGSGNMVHNLGLVAWDKLDKPGFAYDWAIEANEKMKKLILAHDHDALIEYTKQGRAFAMAIPTPEHYVPLLYALALKEESDRVSFFNDKPVGGSLTMTSVLIG